MATSTQPNLKIINKRGYHLNYAPHIGLNAPDCGMFVAHAGKDPLDQIKFIAERGFAGIEDNFTEAALGRSAGKDRSGVGTTRDADGLFCQ